MCPTADENCPRIKYFAKNCPRIKYVDENCPAADENCPIAGEKYVDKKCLRMNNYTLTKIVLAIYIR